MCKLYFVFFCDVVSERWRFAKKVSERRLDINVVRFVESVREIYDCGHNERRQ